ncbi:CARDB domain-containing protein [Hymenobacter cellulosivorans]|uniref:T9SS type A sorting domain-containing protein n=1 Tax=Hymenobacter cellulosivorans TaxID=2932249 RepID=A0ABY4F9H7_9BACT|nr:CARDB domain-containing protein [Hymenobacter cellulosivorans]UOQ53320.1 T9SS type A sorting domain-containing protein [Hymenobacter cellulosivorans]
MTKNYSFPVRPLTARPAWLTLLVALLVCWSSRATAQTYTLPTTGNTAITTCSGVLYDNGGAAGNYSPNADGSVTINPATAGNKVKLQFNTFSVGYYDRLTIYDGATTSSPIIGTYYDYYSPGTVYGTSTSGSLTVRFATDYYASGYSGFSADISCVTTVPQPDLAIQGASVSPVSVVPGNSLSLYSSIYNLSGTTATSSNIGYYLSTDASLDAADVLLGNSTGSSLTVGNYSSRTSYVQLPATITAGAYYVLFVADYQNVVNESNETNNVSSVYLNVVPPSVDLLIQQPAVSPTSTAPGNVLNLACYIVNQGNATAAYSSVGYYLSSNTTLDANDQLLSSTYGSTLTPNYSSYRTATTNVPPGLAPGTYYILFAADYQSLVSESNENNNVSAVTLTVAAPSVDLIVSQASLSTYSMSAGTTITAGATVYNQGNTTASSSNLGYYLSTDATLSSNDALLGSSTGGALSSGLSNYPSTSITIPAGTTPGSYYVLFAADYQNQVTESNETNNVRSQAITVVTPSIDLVIQSAYLNSSTTTAGTTISASHYIVNQGNTVASSSNVGYYLSTDATFSSADVLLTSTAGGTLTAGNYSTRYPSLTIPAGTAAGTYYVLFVADYQNQVTETNENNNVASAQLTVVTPGIDLAILQAYLNQTSSVAGGTVSGSHYIINQGTTAAASSNVGYYLSTDATLSTSDVLLSNSASGTLYAGGYNSLYPSLTIPTGTTPGSYYVLFVADYQNSISETNENNNVAAAALTIVAPVIDLTIQSPSISTSSTAAGGTIGVNYYAINQGTTSSPGFTVGHYLSTDATLSANDVLLTSTSSTALAPGGYTTLYPTMVIPANTSAGTYYVLIVADHQNTVSEVNENNNVATLTLRVTAPFSGVLVPVSGATSITTCNTTVADNGGNSDYVNNSYGSLTINPATAGAKVRLVFSSFAVESCCDQLYIYDGPNTNSPLIGYYTANPGTITAQNTSGSLTLLFTSDGSVVGSGFEATASCVTVTSQLPDLIVQSPSVSATSVAVGNTVSLGGTVRNQGGGDASSSQLGYYLSTDNTLSSGDLLLGTSSGGALAAGQTTARAGTFSIPTGVTPGTYYVVYAADPAGAVTESNETNNTTSLTLTIVAALPDLVVSQTALSPASAPAGTTVSASCLLTNSGTAAAAQNTMAFYLSTDASLSSNDVLLASTTAAALPAGSGNTRAASLTIPAGTVAGNYYVLYVADATGIVAESNEQNNVASRAFTVSLPSPVREQLNGFTLNVYPNPATGGEFKVRMDGPSTGKAAQLTLFNSIGQQVGTQTLVLTAGRGPVTFDTTNLGSGVYTLRITGEELNVTRRVVIE